MKKIMVWTSKEIKKKGLSCLNQNFAQAYLIVLLLRLIADIPALLFEQDYSIVRLTQTSSILLILLLLSCILLVYLPLTAGKHAYYLDLGQDRADFSTLWKFFTQGSKVYLSIVKGMAIRYLTVCAGGLILIVPGILQYYRTFFTPWILAENPEMSGAEAMRISRDMTAGQRMNLFIMQLTFLGWIALCFFLSYRFSLLLPTSIGRAVSTAVYALPGAYYHAAVAELYHQLKG
ncbi:DUF975 family protein [Faecalicatena sp. AGMB00832]|uniref:DUF975 family protein n=1 Tax=Faecalicatena faecalis TaxID=2726362 RepID=A0ABS6D6L5_9FIRM|nr:DUF975 family protein [Faecalicatena faecalis]MBU3876822.1 DUF975 family protein [Faecalicatena faecalis]